MNRVKKRLRRIEKQKPVAESGYWLLCNIW